MSAALISALIFTVVLFVTTAYFLMGAIPLLILKHDTDLDSRFVRGFFNTNYLAAMVAGGATALSYAWAGNLIFSAGAAALARWPFTASPLAPPGAGVRGPQTRAHLTQAIRRE